MLKTVSQLNFILFLRNIDLSDKKHMSVDIFFVSSVEILIATATPTVIQTDFQQTTGRLNYLISTSLTC